MMMNEIKKKKEKREKKNEIPAHLGASFIGDYVMTQNSKIAQQLQVTRRRRRYYYYYFSFARMQCNVTQFCTLFHVSAFTAVPYILDSHIRHPSFIYVDVFTIRSENHSQNDIYNRKIQYVCHTCECNSFFSLSLVNSERGCYAILHRQASAYDRMRHRHRHRHRTRFY